MKLAWRLVGASALLALAVVGCGDDDGGGEEAAPSSTTTTTAETTTTAAPAEDGRFGPLGEQPSLVITVPGPRFDGPTIGTARVDGGTPLG